MRPAQYDSETDLYYVSSGAVTLGIPFAYLRAFKEAMGQGTTRTNERRLIDYYNSLPNPDKKLFKAEGIKKEPDNFYPDQHYED